MSGVVEKYYTAQEVAFLLSYSVPVIIEKAKAGEFGGAIFVPDAESKGVRGRKCVKGDWRLPAAGVNEWCARHQWSKPNPSPTVARSPGELIRKVQDSKV